MRINLDRPVVLIGLMGSGKTHIGRSLAQALDLPFTDSDAEIVTAVGTTIADFFEQFGEAAFRDGERRVIERLLDGPLGVLATGGGAFIEPGTRAVIKDKGISVWLKADLALLVERTAGKTHRPLLMKGEPEVILKGMIDKRYPIYAEADITLDIHRDESPQVITERILAALEDYLNTQKTDQ